MTISNFGTLQNLTGQPVVDNAGNRIGTVSQIYVDNQSGQPEWATVRSGLLKSHSTFVPLQGAQVDGDTLVVDFDKDEVKHAPQFEDEGALRPEQERRLYEYYDMENRGAAAQIEYQAGDLREPIEARGTGTDGRSAAAPDMTDDAMTRSEERLEVGTARHEAGRAKLSKHVVTEQVHTTVPVSHEEAVIQREPVTDANRGPALSGPDITEAEHEVVLDEERPVVQKEVVPVERVRLSKQNVADEVGIDETVRKERIDARGAVRDNDQAERR